MGGFSWLEFLRGEKKVKEKKNLDKQIFFGKEETIFFGPNPKSFDPENQPRISTPTRSFRRLLDSAAAASPRPRKSPPTIPRRLQVCVCPALKAIIHQQLVINTNNIEFWWPWTDWSGRHQNRPVTHIQLNFAKILCWSSIQWKQSPWSVSYWKSKFTPWVGQVF